MTIMLTELSGVPCGNTCFGWSEGDNTPDIYGIFGAPLSQVIGNVDLTFDAGLHVVTVNGHALPAGVSATVSFTDPLLVSFAEGAAKFTAVGPPNPWGFIATEVEYICPTPFTPGVPEPSTVALMLMGGIFLSAAARFRCWTKSGRNGR